MMRLFLLITGLFLSTTGIWSQVQWEEQNRDLCFFADVMVNAQDGAHRERAALAFNQLIQTVLNDPQSFHYSFEKIRWVSVVMPEDGAFRLITWQWQNELQAYEYAGVLQMNDGTLHWLNALKNEPPDLEFAGLTTENWLGQVYYDLHEYNTGSKAEYLLFGYRMSDNGTIVKTAEPLTVDGGKAIFGKELFFDEKRHGKTRLIIRYSSNATAYLKYDKDLEMIVFDNIVSIINPYESGAVRLVPEGTYKAYKFENGKWRYEDSILDTKYETPPVQNPKTQAPRKDLFGR